MADANETPGKTEVSTTTTPETWTPEGWDQMSNEEKLKAVQSERSAKLAANTESKERRLKLAKIEEAERLEADKNLAAVDLLKKKEAELLTLTGKLEALENQVRLDKVVGMVSSTLVGKGFKPELVALGIKAYGPTLSEETAEQFVKDFSKEFKDLVQNPTTVKSSNPFAALQPKAKETAPDTTPGRTDAERSFARASTYKPGSGT